MQLSCSSQAVGAKGPQWGEGVGVGAVGGAARHRVRGRKAGYKGLRTPRIESLTLSRAGLQQ